MPIAEKGVRGKAAGLSPPQHTVTLKRGALQTLRLTFGLPTSCKLEMFASAAVVRHALIMPDGVVSPSSALGPSTSRITTARSRNACAPLP